MINYLYNTINIVLKNYPISNKIMGQKLDIKNKGKTYIFPKATSQSPNRPIGFCLFVKQ